MSTQRFFAFLCELDQIWSCSSDGKLGHSVALQRCSNESMMKLKNLFIACTSSALVAKRRSYEQFFPPISLMRPDPFMQAGLGGNLSLPLPSSGLQNGLISLNTANDPHINEAGGIRTSKHAKKARVFR